MGLLKGKDLLRQERLGSLSYFDILAGLAALALASACLTLAVSTALVGSGIPRIRLDSGSSWAPRSRSSCCVDACRPQACPGCALA